MNSATKTATKLFILITVCFFFHLGICVDQSKFKKCDQSYFCKTNRHLSQTPELRDSPARRPQAQNLKFEGSKLTADVVIPELGGTPLSLELVMMLNSYPFFSFNFFFSPTQLQFFCIPSASNHNFFFIFSVPSFSIIERTERFHPAA